MTTDIPVEFGVQIPLSKAQVTPHCGTDAPLLP